MRIGIDVRPISRGARSIIVWQTRALLELEVCRPTPSQFVLYFSSLREPIDERLVALPGDVEVSRHRYPARLLHEVWTRVGWPPIEALVGRVDLFHSMTQLLPPQRSGLRVVTLYDAIPFIEPAWTGSSGASVKAMRRSALAADRLITISESSKRDLCEALGIDGSKVTVVYPAVEPLFREPSDAVTTRQILRRHGVERPYLLHVGQAQPRRNCGSLFRAVAALPKTVQAEYELLMLGDLGRRDQETLKALAKASPQMRVRFLGRVSDIDLRALYTGATALVCVSFREGFGLPVLEAMTLGVPVVVSDAGALAEVVRDAGVKVDVKDPGAIAEGLRSVLDGAALRARCAEAGRLRAAEFTWEGSAARLRSVYTELAGAGG